MTDLPEALPILRHNTNATFGPANHDDASDSAGGYGATGRCLSKSEVPGGEAERPKIRQLCWGNAAEAERIAPDAEEGEISDCHGFDLIVVRRRPFVLDFRQRKTWGAFV